MPAGLLWKGKPKLPGQLTAGMAGAGGFEPPHGGTKNRCLTAWRRPNVRRLLERGGAARNHQATAPAPVPQEFLQNLQRACCAGAACWL